MSICIKIKIIFYIATTTLKHFIYLIKYKNKIIIYNDYIYQNTTKKIYKLLLIKLRFRVTYNHYHKKPKKKKKPSNESYFEMCVLSG